MAHSAHMDNANFAQSEHKTYFAQLVSEYFIQRLLLEREPRTANCQTFQGVIEARLEAYDVTFARNPRSNPFRRAGANSIHAWDFSSRAVNPFKSSFGDGGHPRM